MKSTVINSGVNYFHCLWFIQSLAHKQTKTNLKVKAWFKWVMLKIYGLELVQSSSNLYVLPNYLNSCTLI